MKIGDVYSYTCEITQCLVDEFGVLFSDRNPLHMNEEYAKSKGFAGRVAHGNILGGMLSHLIGECLPVDNVIIHKQQFRFHLPVYIGNRLTLQAHIIEEHPAVAVYVLRFSFTNNEEKKVASGLVQIGVL